MRATGNQLQVFTPSGPERPWDIDEAAEVTEVDTDLSDWEQDIEQGAQLLFAGFEHPPAIARFEKLAEDRVDIQVEFPGTSAKPIRPPRDLRYTLQVTTQRNMLAVWTGDQQRTGEGWLRLFRAEGQPSTQISIPGLRGLRLSDNGERILAISSQGSALFDETGARLADLPGARDGFIARDGSASVVFGTDGAVFYQDATRIGQIPATSPLRDAAFSSEPALVAVAERDRVYIYDLQQKAITWRRANPTRALQNQSIDIEPDGVRLAIGRLEIGRLPMKNQAGQATGQIVVLDRAAPSRAVAPFQLGVWNSTTPDVRFIPQRREVAALCADSVRLFDPEP